MKRIYSCKLYLTSQYKDKINAAINDPLNSELVQQLSSYLDEEPNEVADEKEVQNSATESPDKEVPSQRRSTLKPAKFHSNSDPDDDEFDIDARVSDDIGEEFEGDSAEDAKTDEGDDASKLKPESEDVTSSSYVKSSTSVGDISCDVLKGTLNSVDDTSGVSRVSIKEAESEVWIYYEDKVNLNNIMTAAISLIESSGYHYLEFNRLARSDNAIVFQILNKSSDSNE